MKNIKLAEQYEVLDSPKVVKDLVVSMPEYAGMLTVLSDSLPAIKASSENFHKTQSQFMDNMLTVSHPTPLRNVRQILAEINKTELALKEAYIKVYKKEIEIQIKRRELDAETDELKQKLIQLDMLELSTHLEATKSAVGGAIRRITHYTEQYNSILNKHNLHNFTEEDFENEEEKYHIMKAFDQGVTAARTRPDASIDEGNMIYLTQIGINGAHAQLRVTEYLQAEKQLLAQGKAPTHGAYLSFLDRCAQEFAGCSKQFAEVKGLSLSKVAMLGVKDGHQ